MASTFPSVRDAFINPVGTQLLGSVTVPHDNQHDHINDAMVAVQSYCPARLAQIVADGVMTGFDFTSIPQIYETLEVVIWGRSQLGGAGDGFIARFNGDTAAHYYQETLTATNATVTGLGSGAIAQLTAASLPGSTAPAGAVGVIRLWIPAYARNAFNKRLQAIGSCRQSSVAAGQITENHAGEWDSVVAITEVNVYSSSASIVTTGSVATLYGWP